MSSVWRICVVLICALCVKALGGWICDGERPSSDAGDLQEQVSANASAVASLSTAKVDKGESLSMPMDDAGGQGTTWHEWSVGGVTETNGNWRLGVVNSNFVIQAREPSGWTNAVTILKP